MNDLTVETVQNVLQTRVFGRALEVHACLESTNLTLEERARVGAPEGLVVVADQQTGGRGRAGRKWSSPPHKNLYVSLLARPSCTPGLVPQLALLTALAVHDALCAACCGQDFRVKWPNDVLCGGRKLCGILCTMSCQGTCTDYAVVGVGINVNAVLEDFAPEVRDVATSLALLARHEFSRANVLASFLDAWERRYDAWLAAGSLAPFLDEWRQHSLLEGKHILVQQGNEPVSGTVDGITPEGHLILRNGDQTTLAVAGDAHILPANK